MLSKGEGLLVATKGLYEYEVYRDGKNTMGITLLRAIGEMGDWFYFPTPNGQMQGEYEYSYCLIPFDADFSGAVERGYDFTYPKLCALQEGKHDGVDALKGVNVTTEGTLLTSAVKKAEKDNGLIVRFYDAYDCKSNVTLTVPNTYTKAYLCDLMENEIKELTVKDGNVTIPTSNFEIVTVKFAK